MIVLAFQMSLGFFKRGMQADFEAGHISNVPSETTGENQRKPRSSRIMLCMRRARARSRSIPLPRIGYIPRRGQSRQPAEPNDASTPIAVKKVCINNLNLNHNWCRIDSTTTVNKSD